LLPRHQKEKDEERAWIANRERASNDRAIKAMIIGHIPDAEGDYYLIPCGSWRNYVSMYAENKQIIII
jgi:hypothetical protein